MDTVVAFVVRIFDSRVDNKVVECSFRLRMSSCLRRVRWFMDIHLEQARRRLRICIRLLGLVLGLLALRPQVPSLALAQGLFHPCWVQTV